MSIELTTADSSLRKDISKTLPLWAPYANYFDFESDLTTDIQTTNTYVKLNTNTVLGFQRDGLVHTNNRLTNTGEDGVFEITAIVSLSGSPNKQIKVAVFKNDEIWPCSEQNITTGVGGKANNLSLQCLIDLDEGDYVEIWAKNATDSTNITLDNINVTLKRV